MPVQKTLRNEMLRIFMTTQFLYDSIQTRDNPTNSEPNVCARMFENCGDFMKPDEFEHHTAASTFLHYDQGE